MAEQSEEKNVTVTTNSGEEVKATVTTKKVPGKTSKKQLHTKMLKSEVLSTPDGTKMTVVFPGTSKTQRDVYDASTMPNGARSLAVLYQKFMDEIINSSKIDWKFFDSKITKSNQVSEVVVEEDDGTETTYKLKFPGVRELLSVKDAATDSFGRILDGPLFQSLIASVIQNKDVKNLDYFDSHNGYLTLMQATTDLLNSWLNESEVYDYMNLVDDFIQRMFR